MKTYWSNTKIADWIRGTAKPTSATSGGWHTWEKNAKETHPIRYWIVEEGLDKIQTFIRFPMDTLYNAKYYINNRWVTRTNSLTAHPRDIKPGQWQDVGNRFLPCLFNELVEFVEVETAWLHIAWDDEATKKYNPPFYAKGWFRWRTWRSPQAGLDILIGQQHLPMKMKMVKWRTQVKHLLQKKLKNFTCGGLQYTLKDQMHMKQADGLHIAKSVDKKLVVIFGGTRMKQKKNKKNV